MAPGDAKGLPDRHDECSLVINSQPATADEGVTDDGQCRGRVTLVGGRGGFSEDGMAEPMQASGWDEGRQAGRGRPGQEVGGAVTPGTQGRLWGHLP